MNVLTSLGMVSSWVLAWLLASRPAAEHTKYTKRSREGKDRKLFGKLREEVVKSIYRFLAVNASHKSSLLEDLSARWVIGQIYISVTSKEILRENHKRNLNINKSRPPAGHVNCSSPQRPLGKQQREEKRDRTDKAKEERERKRERKRRKRKCFSL